MIATAARSGSNLILDFFCIPQQQQQLPLLEMYIMSTQQFLIYASLFWARLDAFSINSSPSSSFVAGGRQIGRGPTATATATALFRQPDKWDLILDELDDEDDDEVKAVGSRGPVYLPHPPDMAYEPRIVKRAYETFHAIRGAGGKETTNDVYVRGPVEKDVFWYTGKVARVSDVSLEDCIQRLYPMIERHACHLRPKELYPHRGNLDVWTAPGDSEMEVAYNRASIRLEQFLQIGEKRYKAKGSTYPSHIKASMVGFQGEVYQDGEDGFRTWRNDDGMPARPEINPGGENRPPTEEELQRIQQEVGGNFSSNTGEGIIDAVVTKASTD